MKPPTAIATILLTAALTTLPSQAQPGPLIRSGNTHNISPHVYVIPDTDTTPGIPNIGIVVGTRAALVIDTGMGDRNGRTVLAEAQKAAPGRALYLVTTHVHPEHDLEPTPSPPPPK